MLLCKSMPLYAMLKQRLCSNVDISSLLPNDPANPCDSLSFGSRFEGVHAILSDIDPPTALDPFCAPDDDPEQSSCDDLH